MAFWSAARSSGITFRDTVEIVDIDNNVVFCRMNFDGSIYSSGEEIVYDDDSNSLDLGRMETDEDGLAFLDAEEEPFDVNNLFSNRFVLLCERCLWKYMIFLNFYFALL